MTAGSLKIFELRRSNDAVTGGQSSGCLWKHLRILVSPSFRVLGGVGQYVDCGARQTSGDGSGDHEPFLDSLAAELTLYRFWITFG
jgi:hypothetical protein